MREKNVLPPVAIEVRHADPKRWCELGFRRQWDGIEVILAIKKNSGGQGRGGELAHLAATISHHINGGGTAPGGVGGKAFGNPRHSGGHGVPEMARNKLGALRIEFSLQNVRGLTAGQIAVEYRQWMFRGRAPATVQTPVARDDVKPAVAVKVARRHALPQAGQLIES